MDLAGGNSAGGNSTVELGMNADAGELSGVSLDSELESLSDGHNL